jgi:transcriptional regulator with XRE-family HTH domain
MISPKSAESVEVDSTAKSSVPSVIVEIPHTFTSLVNEVAGLRDQVQEQNIGVADLYRRINAFDLDRRTAFKVREGIQPLLDGLAIDRGMSWNDIARLVHVSPQSVRKWRKGEQATGDNRLGVAKLAAFLDVLSELGIGDAAQWLEVPIVEGYPVTGFDLYAAGKIDLLLEWADRRIDSPERLLDQFDGAWREKYRTMYETFKAGDGNLSIRRRD